MAVNAEHRVKIRLARKRRAVADKAREAAFFNVAGHRITVGDRSIGRRRRRRRLAGVVICWLRLRLGVVFAGLGLAVAPSHSDHVSYLSKMICRKASSEPERAKSRASDEAFRRDAAGPTVVCLSLS